MATRPPPVDARTVPQLAEQNRKLLRHYLGGAPYNWSGTDDGGEAGRAVTGVFAHLCGQVIERINRAPEKNFLAFLDLLGNAPVPPMPARVPLSFMLEASAAEGLAVPTGTRAQADPAAGGGDPVVFETERELWLTTLELKAFDKTPRTGLATRDVTQLILTAGTVEERREKQEGLFDVAETLHFGFDLAAERALPVNRPVVLFFFIDDATYDSTVNGGNPDPAVRVIWEYSNGTEWKELLVEDATQGLTRSGTLEFLLPLDVARLQRHLFERRMFWVRASLSGPTVAPVYAPAPRLKGVALNTVMAAHTRTITDEVLGSSSGNAGQRFKTFATPVLPGQELEVLERRRTDTGAEGRDTGEWIAWQEVFVFHASTPQDRHYLIDRLSGELRFGNGTQGMIPPRGTRNLRLARYQTGGGRAGNVGAGRVKNLLASQRSIRAVTNYCAAAGGAEAETNDSLLDRAPRALRHRGRAATSEDYEDLARLASADVARARSVPLIDLAVTPCRNITEIADEEAGAGRVSVIIVPQSAAEKPLPSRALLDRIAEHLRRYGMPTIALSVVGPLYLRVHVELTLRLTSIASDGQVKRQVGALLAEYLHPLTGRGGAGWSFGRRPHDSDINRLLADVPGIDHVSSLRITLSADERPLDCIGDPVETIEATGRFLICAGPHVVTTF